MIWVFIGFTLLLIPTMHGFNQGDAYEGDAFVGKANTMIGNLGYSSVECTNIPMSLGNLVMTCPYGTVGKVFHYGVNNPDLGSPIDACTNNEFNKKCNGTTGHFKGLFEKAIGKESYKVTFTQSDIYWSGNMPGKECTDPTNLVYV